MADMRRRGVAVLSVSPMNAGIEITNKCSLDFELHVHLFSPKDRHIFVSYNDLFTWQINGDIDVETVALHEAGHGLSQDHFGKAFVTSSNGKLHFAPLAVMNAGYTGIRHTIDQADLAGHCSIWAQWPNN
jgi:hypothetical protein